MDLNHFRPALPEIRARIERLKPDAIVLGLGPSARLLPEIDQLLLEDVRLFGVNDVFKIMPVHDLVVMDPPVRLLHPATERHQTIAKSTPERLWLYQDRMEDWREHLPPELMQKALPLKLRPYQPGFCQKAVSPGGRKQWVYSDSPIVRPWEAWNPRLEGDAIEQVACSPAGTTVLAWRQGCRRIGVIGVDLLPGTHHLTDPRAIRPIKHFFACIRQDAEAKGGQIINLSPFSKIDCLHPEWKPVAQ